MSDSALADSAWIEQAEPMRGPNWIAPALAGLAIAIWTLFFILAHGEAMAGAPSAQWTSWITDWSVPVVLVIGVWLLAMRNSRREATRFTEVAGALSRESAMLEKRLLTVNRELSLARDFLAAQSLDLEALGRTASERLAAHADHIQSLIRDNGEEVESIARTSESALGNMENLRDQLPVIGNAARDMANQIGGAGNAARAQLDELVGGLDKLNAAGEVSDERIAALREKVSSALADVDRLSGSLDQISEAAFAEMRERAETFRVEIESREADNLSAMRRRAEALGKELSEQDIAFRNRAGQAFDALRAHAGQIREESSRLAGELRQGQSEAETGWARAIESFEERVDAVLARVAALGESAVGEAQARLEALRDEAQRVDELAAGRLRMFEEDVARRRDEAIGQDHAALASLEERIAALSQSRETLATHLAETSEQFAELSDHGEGISARMDSAADGLAARLIEGRDLLAVNSSAVEQLTEASLRLLDLIRASAGQSAEQLPHALSAAQERIGEIERGASHLQTAITQAEERGAALAEHVEQLRLASTGSLESLDALDSRLASIAGQSEAITRQSRADLDNALAALDEASQGVFARLRQEQETALESLAGSLGERSREAIAEALHGSTETALEALREAARDSAASGRETIEQLRAEIALVSDQAAQLRAGVAQARSEAENAASSNLATRMAQITEALQSGALDITRVLDTEVPEDAWATYLRGERGIFARRAVRLLSGQEAREVHQLYGSNEAFREAVNQYIHDFEGLLRTIMALREGNAIAVTLLSSDIGKLYVALAQAIERLRG